MTSYEQIACAVLTTATIAFVAWLSATRRAFVVQESTDTAPWTGWHVFLLLMVALLFELCGMQAVISHYGLDKLSPQVVADFRAPLIASTMAARMATLAVAIIYLRWDTLATARQLGFSPSRLPRDVAIGVLAFLLAEGPIMLAMEQLTRIEAYEHPLMELIKHDRSPFAVALLLISAVGVAPLYEEFFFRVLLQGWLLATERRAQAAGAQSSIPPGIVPNLLTSIVFATLHFDHGPAPYVLFFLSLFYGYLFQRTGRIWPSFTAHLCLNLTTCLATLYTTGSEGL